VKFAKDADVLIHDAQYLDEHYWGQLDGFPSTQGYGHSTVSMACEVAASASAGQLVLFHHDPAYSDEMIAGMERGARKMFENSIAAYEGLGFTLTPDPFAQHPSGAPAGRGESNVAVRLQSPAVNGRDVQYVQNG
jgi:ribonuclease BN (tRNA processing enzyme)